ncbi:MAG: 4-hydroxybutyrate--acetyl-CoA CoA transferase [Oscillospiraceae bacterium]|nr:4-hydroxybutyrate--acetyl-CoA CoA transferase [Oscillospiraceae bacterium]
MNIKDKIVTVDQALDMVQSGFNLTTGMAAAEPVAFQTRLHEIAGKVKDVTITSCLQTMEYKYMEPDILAQSFWLDAWFYTPALRRLHGTGRVSFIPNCLHYAGRKRNYAKKTDIFLASASMPDEDGNVRLSCSNVYESVIISQADKVILECSPNIPRIYGDCVVPADKVSHIIMTDNYLPVSPDAPSNEKDGMIGEHIAKLIDDGDTIQVGIGGIPNAVCASIHGKRGLGVHTEMMTTGIMRLMKAGVITNAKKNFNPGKAVFAFAFGTQEMYEYMHENKELYMASGAWVNDPYIVGLNDNMVSINTTIEVDLMGQCCSETIGYKQFSGSGGQTDTAIGAQRAVNGRSIIALYSTANVKNPKTGEREEISKIVPMLKEGATVTLSRNDVDWVVTEYGAVCLRGLDIKSRVRKMISIAHPKYREELERRAYELEYLIR